MMIVCHESICTGNYLYRFVYILEVVCQWLKVHTLPCYSRDLCSNYERDNSASNATNQPIILISLQPDLTYSTLSLVMILVYAMSTHDAYGTSHRLMMHSLHLAPISMSWFMLSNADACKK